MYPRMWVCVRKFVCKSTCHHHFEISISQHCLFPCMTLLPLILSRLNYVWTDHVPTLLSIRPALFLHLSFYLFIYPSWLNPAGQLRAWVRLRSSRPYNKLSQPCLWCRSLFALCLPVTVGGHTLLFLILALMVQWKDLWASKLNQSN